jgi:hypothetical protein
MTDKQIEFCVLIEPDEPDGMLDTLDTPRNLENFEPKFISKRKPEAVLAARITSSLDKLKSSWMEGTIELMDALHDAKRLFPNKNKFKAWIDVHDFRGLDKNNRTALLNMAEHREKTLEVLRTTERRAWQYVWLHDINPAVGGKKPKPRLPRVRKSAMHSPAEIGTTEGIIDDRLIDARAEFHAATTACVDSDLVTRIGDMVDEITDDYIARIKEFASQLRAGAESPVP